MNKCRLRFPSDISVVEALKEVRVVVHSEKMLDLAGSIHARFSNFSH